jgi:hypothetical protein
MASPETWTIPLLMAISSYASRLPASRSGVKNHTWSGGTETYPWTVTLRSPSVVNESPPRALQAERAANSSSYECPEAAERKPSDQHIHGTQTLCDAGQRSTAPGSPTPTSDSAVRPLPGANPLRVPAGGRAKFQLWIESGGTGPGHDAHQLLADSRDVARRDRVPRHG